MMGRGDDQHLRLPACRLFRGGPVGVDGGLDLPLLPTPYSRMISGGWGTMTAPKGELVALLRNDLNSENRTISASKQAAVRSGKITMSRPKTETSVRRISIPQEAVDLLIQEHEKHPDSLYMFPSPKTGEMYHPDSVVNLHKKIL